MRIGVIDGSNYLKGLLLLVRKDSRISEEEVRLTRRIGKALGFESTFCDNAIREILENKYIVDAPPAFSTKNSPSNSLKTGWRWPFPTMTFIPPKRHGSGPRQRRMVLA